jgi:hypothetical protein
MLLLLLLLQNLLAILVAAAVCFWVRVISPVSGSAAREDPRDPKPLNRYWRISR